MPDEFLVTCPYCGEQVEIFVEEDVRGSFVQDCEVCCNPWRVRVTGAREDRSVDVARGILEGLQRGAEDIYPDPMALQMSELWSKNPKELEKQIAAM